ncbi:hypothetical protein K6L24_09680 [Erwinia persicina]|uniref:hypothetical protein n=1 Tax=Erwinia persicina TaxID=55211 RepID=UPI001C9B2C7B|nr:hypothetical protein [Erwinia persicina]QZQ52003.1 hypothetical protein K6L24_09680 [Erwinia persicina]
MDVGSVTFFDINAFGFYRLKRDSKNLDYKFGTLTEVIHDLTEWLKDKNFEDTLPWSADEQPLKQKVYCRGIVTDPETKDSIIVLYRGVGDGNGIHGIKVGSKIGSNVTGTVKAGSKVGKDEVIWGEALYYWIIPELNKIASIRFPHSFADTYLFCNYFSQHVNNNSRFGERKKSKREVESKNNPGRVVPIYNVTFPFGNGKEKCNCVFKFTAEETKLKAAKENLAALRAKITQTIIRDTTATRLEDPREPILQLSSTALASLFGASVRNAVIGEPPQLVQPKKIQVTVDGAPSLEELNTLFKMREEDSDWVDVGFKLVNDDNPIWLTSYVARTKLPIDGSEGKEHYSPEFLLSNINLIRGDLLHQVKQQLEENQKEADNIPEEDKNEQTAEG